MGTVRHSKNSTKHTGKLSLLLFIVAASAGIWFLSHFFWRVLAPPSFPYFLLLSCPLAGSGRALLVASLQNLTLVGKSQTGLGPVCIS